MNGRGWALFWVIWASVFFVMDIVLMAFAHGGWIFYYAGLAMINLWCGSYWMRQLDRR